MNSFETSTHSSSYSPTSTPFPGYKPSPGRQAYYNEQRNAWQVHRYESVQRVLSDYTTFSSNRGRLDNSPDHIPDSGSLTTLDPPRHHQLRALVAQAFTPKAVARLEPAITSLAHGLLDTVIERGEMDLVSDFSALLPLLVICQMLGVPEQDRPQMRVWSNVYTESTTPAAWQARRDLLNYFSHMRQLRLKDPQDDLISTLLAAQVDGEHLTEEEVLNFCLLLIIAGNETTKSLIANALLCFDEYPDAMEQIRAEPALLPGAIEEVLRYLSPVTSFPRIARINTTIDGQEVKAGQWISPWMMSANRDPEYFDDADCFDIRRDPNRHLTFGAGIHFCLGAPLARMESRVGLAALLERTSELRRVRSMPFVPFIHAVAYSVRSLPLAFRKR